MILRFLFVLTLLQGTFSCQSTNCLPPCLPPRHLLHNKCILKCSNLRSSSSSTTQPPQQCFPSLHSQSQLRTFYIYFYSFLLLALLSCLLRLFLEDRCLCFSPSPHQQRFTTNSNFKLKYKKSKSKCSICLERKSNLITSCQHYYHLECFSSWIEKRVSCPYCNNKEIGEVVVVLCKCRKRYCKYQLDESWKKNVRSDGEWYGKRCECEGK